MVASKDGMSYHSIVSLHFTKIDAVKTTSHITWNISMSLEKVRQGGRSPSNLPFGHIHYRGTTAYKLHRGSLHLDTILPMSLTFHYRLTATSPPSAYFRVPISLAFFAAKLFAALLLDPRSRSALLFPTRGMVVMTAVGVRALLRMGLDDDDDDTAEAARSGSGRMSLSKASRSATSFSTFGVGSCPC